MFKNFGFYSKNLLNIAFPIIVGNLGFILLGIGDVVVAGRHSTDTLIAISLANAIIHCIQTFGIGILTSISPVLSNYRGAKKSPEKYFFPSLKFAIVLSFIVSLILFATIPLIDYLGFSTKITELVKNYFFFIAASVLGGYIHCMAKEFLQAFEIVLFPNIFTIFCVILNVILNIIFVFGVGFVPEMGAVGLAVATFIVRYFMGAILLIYCFKKVKVTYFKDKNYYFDLLKVGLPSSFAILIEFVAFNSIVIIMGRVNEIYAAIQNIVCTITTVSFMVPLAIANAGAVKVGFSNGAKDYISLKRYAMTTLAISIGFMMISSIFVASFPEYIIKLFTADKELILVGVPVVYILCLFQVFDGMQISLAGIFRGLKDTKIIMLSNFISYWIVAIPLGCTLALKFHLNLIGFWYALITSAIVLCTIMSVTLFRKFRKLGI